MTISWTIRNATVEDAAALEKCMKSAYTVYVSRLNGASLPPMKLDYAREIQDFPTWIILFNEEIAGGLTMTFQDGYASIANIAIDPDFQGKGAGRLLIEFAEARSIEQGYSELRLATHVLLIENIKLYSRLGWNEISRDESRVYMSKSLE